MIYRPSLTAPRKQEAFISHQSKIPITEWKPKVQVPAEHYGALYDDWDKWISYYWQIRSIIDGALPDVLEIGVGSRVVSAYLKRNGVRLKTLDIDPALQPDCTGSVTELPFGPNSFDAILCAEVLEHMPFEQSCRAIGEICRVTHDTLLSPCRALLCLLQSCCACQLST